MARQKSSNEGSGGKLIDTWIYEYKGIQEKVPAGADEDAKPRQTVEDKKVEIELRIIKQFADSDTPPLATKEVYFRVVCKEADIILEGPDIEALRCAMWEKLDKKFEVQWFNYFLVEIRPERPYEGIGTGFVFSWKNIEKGIAWDGTELLRERVYGGKSRISPWPKLFRDRSGTVLACIPDNKQNSAALREFRDRIDLLFLKLREFVKPEAIMQTLAGISTSNLLPQLTTETPRDGSNENEGTEIETAGEIVGE